MHVCIGEEAVAAGVLVTLEPEDAVVATNREHGHALLRGVAAGAILAEMYGFEQGCCRGRSGSMHLFDAATRFFGGNAIVAGGLPLAIGLALADKMAGRSRVTACFFGEGAVEEATRRAVAAVRAGAGPHFLELRTYRFRAHSMIDPERYREKAEVAQWLERDPIDLLRAALEAAGELPERMWADLQASVDTEVQAAVDFAEAGTAESVENLTRHVYTERDVTEQERS
ncbi:thiamine pyrophosphate-dependent enzyme [Cryobacterium sp. TMT2-14]|uniref:thiamine pyrophosphate-dependent enzyme n=1 Tax=Cryobacterium sp. TMT2-14 TaxID=1259245 RepID=UPI001F541096|nr:thiamine pyrophosphate-dependent enzyme [Cryobacterium sp. TMT2-14]